MNQLKCNKEGCEEVFSTQEPLHSSATFTCRHHTTKSSQRVFFQECQFDKDLKSSRKPMGTTHVARQGEVEDTDFQRELWSSLKEVSKEKKES